MTERTTIDTKKAERRAVRYAGMDDLLADLDRIEAAHNAGTLRTTGNWSAGQIMKHSAALMEGALDGFKMGPAPWPLRKIARFFFLKKALTGAPPPPGYKTPKNSGFEPGDASFEEGIAALRRVAERVNAGERFTHPSPLFEELTHEQWVTLGLGHASLHTSFIHPGGDA